MTDLRRRALLAALAASPAALAGPKKRKARPLIGGYNVRTAPDAAGRAVLARKIRRLDQGRLPGQSGYDAMKANMQQIIEQSVARLDPPRIGRLVALPDDHKRAIAQLYVNATGNSSRAPLLYDLLAHRLTAPQLAEHAQFYGFVPLYVAIARSAPEKLRGFESIASPALAGAQYRGRLHSSNAGLIDLLDMELSDVWMALRLAPIGLFSLKASAFAFVSVVGLGVKTGWWAGYEVAGPILVQGLQTFAPSIWDGIVEGAGWFMENLLVAPPENEGPIQELGASAMGLPFNEQEMIVETGGDYLINEAWSESEGVDVGGGGGGWGGGGGGSGGGGSGGGGGDCEYECLPV